MLRLAFKSHTETQRLAIRFSQPVVKDSTYEDRDTEHIHLGETIRHGPHPMLSHWVCLPTPAVHEELCPPCTVPSVAWPIFLWLSMWTEHSVNFTHPQQRWTMNGQMFMSCCLHSSWSPYLDIAYKLLYQLSWQKPAILEVKIICSVSNHKCLWCFLFLWVWSKFWFVFRLV